MGWSIGFDTHHRRDVGYGVPAYCDHPGCDAEIDRGLAYVCGGEPYGGECGCGLYFCYEHLYYTSRHTRQVCAQCKKRKAAFDAKPDHPKWIAHKLTDESWAEWRHDNPTEVAALILARTLNTPTKDNNEKSAITK